MNEFLRRTMESKALTSQMSRKEVSPMEKNVTIQRTSDADEVKLHNLYGIEISDSSFDSAEFTESETL